MNIRKWMANEVDMIPGLSQEARSQSDWPYSQSWIVSRIALDTENRMYWVEGRLRNGGSFHWGSRIQPLDWRYDLTHAVMEIGRHETRDEAFRREFRRTAVG